MSHPPINIAGALILACACLSGAVLTLLRLWKAERLRSRHWRKMYDELVDGIVYEAKADQRRRAEHGTEER